MRNTVQHCSHKRIGILMVSMYGYAVFFAECSLGLATGLIQVDEGTFEIFVIPVSSFVSGHE